MDIPGQSVFPEDILQMQMEATKCIQAVVNKMCLRPTAWLV